MPRTRRPTVEDLQQQLAAIRAELAAIKGTREVVEDTHMVAPKQSRARTPTAPAAPKALAKGSATPIPIIIDEEHPLAARIEALLREHVMTYGELVDEIGGDERHLSMAFAALRRKGLVFNVGDENRGQWTWVCGEKIEPKALYALVQRLLRVRPLTFEELVAATRINPNRLSNALTVAKRTGQVVNLGTRAKAVWYLPPTAGKR